MKTDGMRRRSLTAVAALVCGVLTLSACGGGGGDDGKSPAQGGGAQAEMDLAAKEADTSVAQIKITPKAGAENVGINDDVKVTVTDGTLDEVTMTATATGAEVSGVRSEDGTSWRPDVQLERATQYQVTVKASDSEGRVAHEDVTFTTVSPEDSFVGYFTPEDGATVGVGMPVSFTFDKAITNKAEIEGAVDITASSGQEVVCHWFTDTRMDCRPEDYWAANTQVTVDFDWDGLEGSPGVTGVQNDRSFSFTTGRSQVSTVDAEAKQMKVVRDGELIRTIPISAGAPETPTYNGQMVISEKFVETRMDGATVGFTKKNGKGEYDIADVPHAMRLSTSGTFIHGNYWGDKSVFGNVNTSHGCVGLQDVQGADDPSTDAAWFYENSLIGDVVTVTNSPDKEIQPDNGLNGWNTDWTDWVAGSALS